jgi:hypothetical protein
MVGDWRHDFTNNGKSLLSEVGAEYTQDCWRFSATIGRTGYTNRTVEAATEFMLNLELFTLGEGLQD